MCPVSWVAGAVVGGDVKHTILEIVKQFSAKYMKPEIIPRTVSDSQVLDLPVFMTQHVLPAQRHTVYAVGNTEQTNISRRICQC